MRGEYGSRIDEMSESEELPPRARRIRKISARKIGKIGTTSACAENTSLPLLRAWPQRNYLRVRGEYGFVVYAFFEISELPPRARRICINSIYALETSGTTSACAENTPLEATRPHTPWNYLRVRGEY